MKKILLSLLFTMILMNVFANTVSLEVDKNKRTDKKSFGDHDKKSGQIFTLTITPKIGPNDTIEEVVNKAHGSVIILMPEGAGGNGTLSFQAIEVDTSAGYFNMVTTGKVKEGKKPTGTQKGSTSNGDWDFTGTGTGSLNCNNSLDQNYIPLPFAPSIDDLKKEGCKIDSNYGSFSMPISSATSLQNLMDKIKVSLHFVNQNGKQIFDCGMFAPNVTKTKDPSNENRACLKCKDKEFFVSMTFKYPFGKPTIYITNWIEANAAGPKTQKFYNDLIDDIMRHENVHFSDTLTSYETWLYPARYEKTCCKKASISDYNDLMTTPPDKLFERAIKEQEKNYEFFKFDFNTASDKLHENDKLEDPQNGSDNVTE